MYSVLRFILFVFVGVFYSLTHSRSMEFGVVEWILVYYLMFACLYEAWVYFYYARRKINFVRSQYALFFYILYFYIFLCGSLNGWKDLYNLIYYYVFYSES